MMKSSMGDLTAQQELGRIYKAQAAGLPKETPFTRLDAAIERLREVSAAVAGMSSRLVGEPVPEGQQDRRDGGPGLFGDIEEAADTINILADDIMTEVKRITERL